MKHARTSRTAAGVHAVPPQPTVRRNASKTALCGQRPTGTAHATGYWRGTEDAIDCKRCLAALERLGEQALAAGLGEPQVGPYGGIRPAHVVSTIELAALRRRLAKRERSYRRALRAPGTDNADAVAKSMELAQVLDELDVLLEPSPSPSRRITVALPKRSSTQEEQ